MEAIVKLFARDLDKLNAEITSFKNEDNLWRIEGDIKNTAGNLCLHLFGNLNHFIGAVIGDTGYVRNREAEFADKDVSRAELVRMAAETKETVLTSLKKMNKDKLESIYPIEVFGEKMTYEFFLIHLISHLNYHLGQINYLRRIFD
jgi:uncharacterized damage-inducible protein DinB